ncbi:hypothetical protein ACOT81_22585 [Streptomyces sp. WI04-05B]|uniref:hypothetical protein n=1 Tax=Streptomyces TaxID=1883 RepID=UPI0029ABC8C6|nr:MULTISPECIES: hypothetical protein [unclassified Streptomyces]MDX2543143.1 hypothetical protein [Streptomyces sp. WI04-05B]MDX2584816.1 hypothetical protein [Streptomyces sp. WI04-05A]MDX3752092.1 hypothetical protein [Streptomyces sp. AK08-02]
MPIIITFDFPGTTQAQYEQVTNRMTGGRPLEKASDWPVPGLISHATGPSPTGWFVTDVWESEDAFRQFGEKLAPLLREAGIPETEPKIYQAFNVVSG